MTSRVSRPAVKLALGHLGIMMVLLMQYTLADQRAPELEPLFDALQSPQTTSAEASQVTAEIWDHWLQADTPRAQELMDLGIARMNELALDKAVVVFSELIEIAPEYAEAWNKRATVYYLMGEYKLSAADVQETLRLEPRHFGAISGQGLIYMQVDRKAEALYWFRRALRVNPFLEGVQHNVDMLEEILSGTVI